VDDEQPTYPTNLRKKTLVGDHSPDLARFGYRSEMKVELIGVPAILWRHDRT